MIQADKIQFGIDGNYGDAVYVGTTDGQNLLIKDAIAGEMTLTQLLATVATHSISAHEGMDTDFAQQYYNESRLAGYIADPVKGSTVGVSGDVGGNTSLGSHVADEKIHQRVPKFVLRVAKGGQQYSTITEALAAVPTVGADVPGPSQWWRIEVSPGSYNESVLLEKQWVEIVGAGPESTRISYSNASAPGTWPLIIAADNTVVRDLAVQAMAPTIAESIAVLVGLKDGSSGTIYTVLRNCHFFTLGEKNAWVSPDVEAQMYNCQFTGNGKIKLQVDQGNATVTDCGFYGGSDASVAAIDVVSGNVDVRSTYADRVLVQLTNATASVNRCHGSTAVAVQAGGGSQSIVTWDGLGFQSTFGTFPGSVSGSLLILKANDAGLFTGESVEIEWLMNPAFGLDEQRQLRAGHTGQLQFVGAEFGSDGPDFHFYRDIDATNDAGLAGDIFAIGDDSTSDVANTANVLALYVGAGNPAGKYLRWIDGDVNGSELGYIARDGKVHAPGFVGSGANLTGVQLTNANITALAALATTGIVTRTGTGTVAARTLTGTANLITVTNGNGGSGNPTFTVGANVARRDQANTFSQPQAFGAGVSMPSLYRIPSGADLVTAVTASHYRFTINTDPTYKCVFNLPSLFSVAAGTTFVFSNVNVISNATVINGYSGEAIAAPGAHGGYSSTVTMPTTTHTSIELIAEPSIFQWTWLYR